MRLNKQTIQGNGASVQTTAPIPLNWRNPDFKVSVAVDTDGSTTTATVQHTFDDVNDPDVTPVWFDHADIAAVTAKNDGNYAYPVRAVRLSIGATGTDTWTFWVLQAGG